MFSLRIGQSSQNETITSTLVIKHNKMSTDSTSYLKRLFKKSSVPSETDGFKFSFVLTENLVLLSCYFEHFTMKEEYNGL